jgi:hypothetical protein
MQNEKDQRSFCGFGENKPSRRAGAHLARRLTPALLDLELTRTGKIHEKIPGVCLVIFRANYFLMQQVTTHL